MTERALEKASAVNPTAVLAVLCAASFMATLDVFIVNVAFPAIGHDFAGSSLSDLSWILNGYAIVYAALLVPLGRLADRYGRKTVFLAGLTTFTVASAACAASPGLWALVAFRVLQALGAAALTPTSLGLLLNATPPAGRAKAVRTWAATGALAAAVGPVVGGLLVQAAWQWVFIVNVPVGLVAFVATVRTVPDSRDRGVSRAPDLVGSAVIALSIAALALALVKGPDWGWASGRALASLAVAVAAAGLFVHRIATHASPVIEPALLRVRAFAWSNVAALAFGAAFAASLLAVILWLQDVWHYSALRTGFAVAPGPLLVPVLTVVAHRLARRLPVGVVAALGCALFGAGNVPWLAPGQQQRCLALTTAAPSTRSPLAGSRNRGTADVDEPWRRPAVTFSFSSSVATPKPSAVVYDDAETAPPRFESRSDVFGGIRSADASAGTPRSADSCFHRTMGRAPGPRPLPGPLVTIDTDPIALRLEASTISTALEAPWTSLEQSPSSPEPTGASAAA